MFLSTVEMFSLPARRLGSCSVMLQRGFNFTNSPENCRRSFSACRQFHFKSKGAQSWQFSSNAPSRLTTIRNQFTKQGAAVARDGNVSVTVPSDRKSILVDGVGVEPASFHSIWLRHNCQCTECKQPYSGQKSIDVNSLKPSYTVSSARLNSNDEVCVEWNEEDHQSLFPVKFLKENSYSNSALNERRLKSMLPLHENLGFLPKIDYKDLLETKDLLRWLRLIAEHGLCLVQNVPASEGTVKSVVEMIWPVQHTIYGHTWDVKSDPHPINIAYSDVKLDFHLDLAYYESPPGIQFLHCVRFDKCVEGGQNLFVDAWHVAESLRSEHPDDFEVLTRVPATFQKIHWERDNPVYMTYQRPHISVSPDGRVVGVFWAPAFEGPLQVSADLVDPYYRAYHRFASLVQNSPTKVEFRLVPGDLICFNNRRILHARAEFQLNGGMRHLQGCYLNIDEFKSCLEVQSRKCGQPLDIKQVFNQSWS